jgi:hypothetical protein
MSFISFPQFLHIAVSSSTAAPQLEHFFMATPKPAQVIPLLNRRL